MDDYFNVLKLKMSGSGFGGNGKTEGFRERFKKEEEYIKRGKESYEWNTKNEYDQMKRNYFNKMSGSMRNSNYLIPGRKEYNGNEMEDFNRENEI